VTGSNGGLVHIQPERLIDKNHHQKLIFLSMEERPLSYLSEDKTA
jgi:hypothetical protein